MSKKLLALGMILGLAACGGGEDEIELEDEGMEVEETLPATPAQPMDTMMSSDTMMMDTMMMDSMDHDTMGM